MKKVLKYILVFVITLIVAVGTLVSTATIPKEQITKSMQESAEYYKKFYGINKTRNHREYTYIYYYADTVVLNIMYCIDTDHPLHSVAEAMYYEKSYNDVNYDFIELVEENKEANLEYLRYWHGSMSILRPLMTFFNIWQIYILIAIIMFGLIVWLMVLLIKKAKGLAFAFLIGLIMIGIPFVSACAVYSWTILLMLIASIIGIKIEKNRPNLLNYLFLIIGMLTCYLDFLTYETLSITIPVLLILIIRYKEERLINIKDGLKFMLFSFLAWGAGYIGMWVAKWILASIVLHINAMDYVTDKALVRIGTSGLALRIQVIIDNIQALFPIANFKRCTNAILVSIIIAIVMLEIIIIDVKKIKELWFSVILLIMASIPYIRYEALLNHAYMHNFFTFRAQLVTIVAIIYIIINSFKARRKWIDKIYKKVMKIS